MGVIAVIRSAVRATCPPILYEQLKRVRRLLPRRTPRPDPLEEEHHRLNAHVPADRIVLRPGIELGLHPESRVAFEFFCFRSPAMVREIDAFLSQTIHKQRLLDIGALHGIFSLVFAAQGADRRAVAVDASPVAFSRLLYNVHKNKFSNIQTVECAVSATDGTLSMHYEWEHLVAARTTSSELAVDVPMRSGDNICADAGFFPDVVKIDVEGHEIKVLQGLWRTLETHKPLLFLEIHPARIREEGDSVTFFARLFDELSYSCVNVDGQPYTQAKLATLEADDRVIFFQPDDRPSA